MAKIKHNGSKKIVVLSKSAICIASLFSGSAYAQDLFWVGGNSNWVDPNANGVGLSNWSLSSGGAPQANIPNSAGENAIVDQLNSQIEFRGNLSIGKLDIQNSSSTFSLIGTSGVNTILTLFANSTNAGTIRFTSEGSGAGLSQISSASNVLLTNTGTLLFANSISGANTTRGLPTDLSNSGTVTVESVATSFFKTNGFVTNTGSFSVASGGVVGMGSNSSFNQNAGTISNNGLFELNGDTFNFNGGDVLGVNPIRLTNSTLNIGSASGVGKFEANGGSNNLSGNVLSGQTITISGRSGINTALSAASSFTSSGLIEFISRESGSGFAQLTIASGQLLTSNGTLHFRSPLSGANFSRFLTGSATSNGTVMVDAGVDAQFTGTGATFTNNGTFSNSGNVTFGSSSVFTQAGGTLINSGSFELNSDTFNFTGGSITGNAIRLVNSTLNLSGTGTGSFNHIGVGTQTGTIASNQVVRILGTSGVNTNTNYVSGQFNSGLLELTSEGSGSGFAQVTVPTGMTLVNDGAVHMKSPISGLNFSRFFTGNLTNNGTVNIDAGISGQFNGTAALTTNNGTFSNSGNVTFGSSSVFTQAGGTLINSGSFELNGDTFNFTGGNITGNAIRLVNSTLNLSGTGTGSFNHIGVGTQTGTIASNQVVRILGTSGVNTNTNYVSGQFSSGLLELTSEGSGSGFAQVTVPSGMTLVNDGTVHLKSPISGLNFSRFFTGNLTNNGTVNIDVGISGQFNGTAALTTNNGTFSNSGNVTFGSSSVFTQAGGTLINSGSFELNSDTFNFTGGSITGSPLQLISSVLNISATGFAKLDMIGTGTLNGNVAAAQIVRIKGISGINTTTTYNTAQVNHGVIELTSEGSGSGFAQLVIPTSNSLTNEGTLHFRSPISGNNFSRSFTGNLTNNESVLFDAGLSVSFNGTSANVQNAGLFLIGQGTTVSFNGSGSKQFGNLITGTLAGLGTLDVSASTSFSNAGDISPGLLPMSPGQLFIQGNPIMSDSADLIIELGGTVSATTYDVLTVTGDIRLDGDLLVSRLGDFIPAPSDVFTVLRTLGTGNTIAGTFDNTPGNVLDVPFFGSFTVTYNSTSVVLSNFQVSSVIPEPSAVGLLAPAALLALRRRK